MNYTFEEAISLASLVTNVFGLLATIYHVILSIAHKVKHQLELQEIRGHIRQTEDNIRRHITESSLTDRVTEQAT